MRVVIADDNALMREGIATVLRRNGFDVAAETASGEELVRAVEEHGPEVAIIDIRMPPTFTDEGIVAAHAVRRDHPSVGVLVLSQSLESSYAMRLLEEFPSGVGYLLKERIADVATLVDTLRRVIAGECVVDPSVVTRLLSRARRRGPLDHLTDRERDVLALMAEGRSNAGIAGQLHLSDRTVETHVSRIFAKLGLVEEPVSGNRRVLAVLAHLRQGNH